jgi:acrylyl-CoA reductase (NADPH)
MPRRYARPWGRSRVAGGCTGETLAWLIRTMQRDGRIAAFGIAGGHELPTSVLPFILRAVNLLEINTRCFDDALRQRLWAWMATDLSATTWTG